MHARVIYVQTIRLIVICNCVPVHNMLKVPLGFIYADVAIYDVYNNI